jgi:hypothetical protein
MRQKAYAVKVRDIQTEGPLRDFRVLLDPQAAATLKNAIDASEHMRAQIVPIWVIEIEGEFYRIGPTPIKVVGHEPERATA